MSRKRLALALMLLLLVLLATTHCWAQVVTGTLVGIVRDTTGAVIPNAKIVVTEISTNVQRTGSTTSDGYFNFPYLSPGPYQIKVDASGFKTLIEKNITISVSTVARVDAVLNPAGITNTVVVTAAPPPLQTESAEVALNLASRPINDLPLEYRNAQALVGLAAGVTAVAGGEATPGDPAGSISFNANGQSNSANHTFIDGVDALDPQDGGTTFVPAPELIQEIHISTSNYSAEFGSVSGGLINISTRRGTNRFHGSLWEYNRNAAFEAKNYFAGKSHVPPLVYNDFGGVLDGPILKNKLFFTGSYRGERENASVARLTTVPTPSMLTGDFSAVPGAQIYNPFTGNPDGTGRTLFNGAKIPHDLIAAQASNVNKYFPAPTNSSITNNFNWNSPTQTVENTYFGRVDFNLSDATKVFAETSIQPSRFLTSGVLPNPLGSALFGNDTVAAPIVNVTHLFSPSLVTELRLAYDLYSIHWRDANTTVTNASLGIADPNPNGHYSETGMATLYAGITIGPAQNSPADVVTQLYQVIDTWSKQLANQSLKWGGEFHRYSISLAEAYNTGFGGRGAFYFEPATTQLKVTSGKAPSYGAYGSYINAFASFLLGTPQERSRTYLTQPEAAYQNQIPAFFQDTWHVTPSLTLDLGVREDYYSPGYARHKGGAARYDPSTNSLYIADYGKNNSAVGVSSRFLVEPRVGFAYKLDADSVIRGGFSMSGWSGRYGFTASQLSGNYPVLNTVQEGVVSGYGYTGSLNSVPAVTTFPIPANGILSPAPNIVFITATTKNPMPYVEAWNLFYERSIGSGFTFDVGYVGNAGKHLPQNLSLNVAAPGTGAAGLRYASFGRTATTTLRGQISWSNYNSLQANLSRRFKDGLFLRAAYTYAKSMDLGSNQGGVYDNLDLARAYGPSDFDSTHNLVVSALYELPFGKDKPFLYRNGILSYLVSGWQANGILRMVSGTPFTVSAVATSCNCPGNSQFGEQIAPVHYLHGIGPGRPWFSTSSFTDPPANQFGNARRNSVRGPDLKQLDFSLFRSFQIREGLSLQGRGEFYNVTNTPSFNNPASNVSGSTFGIISSAAANQRVGQVALTLLF